MTVGLYSIIGNIFLLIIKFIIFFIFGSQAMLADAFNSAGDILSSLMTFIGNKISFRAADDDHHLGHGKAEYIYSLLISVVMIYLSLTVIKSSFLSIFINHNYIFSYWIIIVCVITILVKFLLFLYSNKVYKKYNNILVKTSAIDHRNDCLITFLNLISVFCFKLGLIFIDGIVGIIISLWIIYTAACLFKESYDVLMDKAMSTETMDEVLKIINEFDEIKKINHFNTTPVGFKYQISFTIFVDGNMSTYESHEIANKLEKEIDKRIDEVYLTVIHVNPL